MDKATQTALHTLVGDEVNVPVGLRDRIFGDTLDEMRADAKKLMKDLHLVEPQPRDLQGGFSEMIRSAAGRPSPVSVETPPVGDLGIGQGAAAVPSPPRDISMNALIRGVHRGRRSIEYRFAEQAAAEEMS